MNQATKAFTFVAQALEAESLSGQTATRVVNSVKQLIQAANVPLDQFLAGLTPEQRQVVQAYFS
jgi:methionyl-tRNA synthetase